MPRLSLTRLLSLACCLWAVTPLPARAETGVSSLGRLERESVDEALAELGLTLETVPEGKRVGVVHVVNQKVFSRRDWYFQLLNIFHRTTRGNILQRELLLKPGDLYDQARADESVRNIQTPASLLIANRKGFSPPELSSVVVVVPVKSAQPGTVDLLAVTRDLWSLRFNTSFEFQQNTLSMLNTSLSENNLFGWRKYLSLGFDMDQGRFGTGPTYFDPNVVGTHLTFMAAAEAWYKRGTERYEGDNALFSLRYPLYSLASPWGAGFDVSHQNAVLRVFRGNSLLLEDLTSTPDVVEALPYEYRRKVVTTEAGVTRSFGQTVIQRVSFGHRFDRRRSEVLDDFPDPAAAPGFLAEIAARSETRSELYARYEMFTARYAQFRNLDSFDLRENRRLGPWLKVEVAGGVPALGADFAAVPLSGSAGWAVSKDGGYAYVLVQGGARLARLPGADAAAWRWVDQVLQTQAYFASPLVGRLFSLVVMAETDAVRADTHKTHFFLGGATGLRGYAIGDLEGTTQVIAHVELRSLPVPAFSQRFGGLLFYDVGDAAYAFDQLVPHHDVGLGLRWLIPQLNPSVLRFDWAVATQGTRYTQAGLPGRFSAGYLQVF